MKFVMALVNLYVSLWKAWSVPEPHPYAFARSIRARLYDQELENDTYYDSEFDWPTTPEQARIPSTAIMRMFNPQREWEEYSKSIEYAQFRYEAEEGR